MGTAGLTALSQFDGRSWETPYRPCGLRWARCFQLGAKFSMLQSDTNMGTIVAAADFWRVGPEGTAGSYSSNTGRRVLTSRIRAEGVPFENGRADPTVKMTADELSAAVAAD